MLARVTFLGPRRPFRKMFRLPRRFWSQSLEMVCPPRLVSKPPSILPVGWSHGTSAHTLKGPSLCESVFPGERQLLLHVYGAPALVGIFFQGYSILGHSWKGPLLFYVQGPRPYLYFYGLYSGRRPFASRNTTLRCRDTDEQRTTR